jgi:ferredoxin-NADP reductase
MRHIPSTVCTWRIVARRDEAPHVHSLVLEAIGERPDFTAGQYLTVRIPGFEPHEGKSYSISSTPHDTHLTLTVKEMGGFSKALLSHHVGNTLTTSLPYGFFYPEPNETHNLAFVVGGIGITPCISIIESLLRDGHTPPISLLYSNRTVDDIVFRKRIDALVDTYPNFTAHHFITRGVDTGTPHIYRRMGVPDIHGAIPSLHETDFFVCGSIHFTQSLWKSLTESGIRASHIYTEGFF